MQFKFSDLLDHQFAFQELFDWTLKSIEIKEWFLKFANHWNLLGLCWTFLIQKIKDGLKNLINSLWEFRGKVITIDDVYQWLFRMTNISL